MNRDRTLEGATNQTPDFLESGIRVECFQKCGILIGGVF